MTVQTESWCLVYFALGLGCTSRILEALSQYFNGRWTADRLLTETTSLMSSLNFVKSVTDGEVYSHVWILPDELHSVIVVGIWRSYPGILSVLREGRVYLQLQCFQLMHEYEEMQLVLRTPVTVDFAEDYLRYTTFPLLFVSFTRRLNDLISWNNGSRHGNLYPRE